MKKRSGLAYFKKFADKCIRGIQQKQWDVVF